MQALLTDISSRKAPHEDILRTLDSVIEDAQATKTQIDQAIQESGGEAAGRPVNSLLT